MNKNGKLTTLFYLLALVLLAGSLMTACGKKTEGPAAETIDKAAVASVMGTAGIMQSGVTDAARTEGAVQIKYTLYIPETGDFDEMVETDLAPKIQRLYKTFMTIDRANIVVQTADAANAYAPQPYCEIEITRKVYEQINWTAVLAKDLFKVCKVTSLVREMKK